MRTIKTLSAACTVVFAFTALSAAAATAHEWQLRSLPITKSVSVSEEANLRFTDNTTGARIACTLEEKGTIGPGAAGQIATIKVASCTSLAGCQTGTVQFEALHLPWNTELQTFEAGLGNHILSKPEWKWQCKLSGSTWVQYCNANTNMTVKNVRPNVEETFNPSERTSCLVGGSGLSTEGGGLLKESRANEPISAI